MSFASFRELLARRVGDSDPLQDLIKSISDSALEAFIVEALEKNENAGKAISPPLAGVVGHMLGHPDSKDKPAHGLESIDAALVHDALSHHLSHYSAALKTGNRKLADQHLGKVMDTMLFAHRVGSAAKHRGIANALRVRSGYTAPTHTDPATGEQKKLSHEGTELISPSAWEHNYSGFGRGTKNRPNTKVFSEVPLNWKREVSSNKDAMFPDYAYLEMKPHPHSVANYPEIKQFANSAYPFHEIQVNGHYVNIDHAMEPADRFVDHALDSHPAMEHIRANSGDMKTADAATKYANKHKEWLRSPALRTWLETQAAKGPDAFDRREVKSAPIASDLHTLAAYPYDLMHGRRFKAQRDKSLEPHNTDSVHQHLANQKSGTSNLPPQTAAPSPTSQDPARPISTPPSVPSGQSMRAFNDMERGVMQKLLASGMSPKDIGSYYGASADEILNAVGGK